MACKPCARRRKALEEKKRKKLAEGKTIQAAALTATLKVTAAVG